MRGLLAIGTTLLCAATAHGQGVQPSRPSEPSSPRSPGQPYEQVQQGVEDIGPLGESLESPMLDLRVPTGFERVYLVPDGSGNLMRINGAMHAVFPRSQYVATPFGAMPVVPPGTVFHLGAPREWAIDANGVATDRTGAGASSLRVSNRLDARLGSATADGQPVRESVSRTAATVMSDESYRRERMASILEAALGSGQDSAPGAEGETPAEAPPARDG
ncbi:MAG: hypothetical protein ACF8QF_04125 [Phycisphaerales bacterium]